MKKALLILLLLIPFWAQAQNDTLFDTPWGIKDLLPPTGKIIPKGGIRPDLMPTKTPAPTDAIYTQEDGALKKVTFAEAKTFFNTDGQVLTWNPSSKVLTLENGGTVDLSALATGVNTDDQAILAFSLAGSVLTITLEDGGTESVDLNSLATSYWTYDPSGSTQIFNNVGSKVGIGTSNPVHVLDVNINYAGTRMRTFNYGLELTLDGAGGYYRGYQIRRLTDDKSAIFGAFDGGLYMTSGYNHVTDVLGLAKKQFVLMDSGNVGIGETDPSEKLVLKSSYNTLRKGIIRLDVGYNDVDAGQYVPNKIWSEYYNNSPMEFWLGGTKSAGIPFLKLGILGSSNSQFIGRVKGLDAINSDEFVTKQQIESGLGKYWIKTGNNLSYSLGNIGLGQISPVEKLEVVGNIKATGSIEFLAGNQISFWASGFQIKTQDGVRVASAQGSNNGLAIPIAKLQQLYASGNLLGDGETIISNATGHILPIRLHPTVGLTTTDIFGLYAVDHTYNASLLPGQSGGVENTSVSNITVTAPAGKKFLDKMTESQTIVVAAHSTINFIFDGTNNYYRITSKY